MQAALVLPFASPPGGLIMCCCIRQGQGFFFVCRSCWLAWRLFHLITGGYTVDQVVLPLYFPYWGCASRADLLP